MEEPLLFDNGRQAGNALARAPFRLLGFRLPRCRSHRSGVFPKPTAYVPSIHERKSATRLERVRVRSRASPSQRATGSGLHPAWRFRGSRSRSYRPASETDDDRAADRQNGWPGRPDRYVGTTRRSTGSGCGTSSTSRGGSGARLPDPDRPPARPRADQADHRLIPNARTTAPDRSNTYRFCNKVVIISAPRFGFRRCRCQGGQSASRR